MNHCNVEQKTFMSREDVVACPKPRRVGLFANNIIPPLRFHMSQAATDLCDSKAGAELFNIILTKEEDKGTIGQLLSSSPPPYLPGSPPSRAVNPLAQDARFRDEKLPPFSPNSPFLHPNPSSATFPSPSSPRGCVRTKFGLKPPAVRVEGFDCFNRDRHNPSIPAMA